MHNPNIKLHQCVLSNSKHSSNHRKNAPWTWVEFNVAMGQEVVQLDTLDATGAVFAYGVYLFFRFAPWCHGCLYSVDRI